MLVAGGALALAGCEFTGPLAPLDGPLPDAAPDARPDAAPQGRVIDDHLVGLWRFAEGAGAIAADTVSALRPGYAAGPMSLRLQGGGYTWVPGGLRIDGAATIRTTDRPHLHTDINRSGAVTLELWVTPARVTAGVASTLFTYGAGSANCSVRVMQVGDRYVGCAKVTGSGRGPVPPLPSPPGSAALALQHVAIVASATERAIYVDGVATAAPEVDRAALGSWIDAFEISLGNESGSAPWLGTVWLAAVYDRALSAAEIARNRAAGHDCPSC